MSMTWESMKTQLPAHRHQKIRSYFVVGSETLASLTTTSPFSTASDSEDEAMPVRGHAHKKWKPVDAGLDKLAASAPTPPCSKESEDLATPTSGHARDEDVKTRCLRSAESEKALAASTPGQACDLVLGFRRPCSQSLPDSRQAVSFFELDKPADPAQARHLRSVKQDT
ncbi:unnamed protein product [Polarella glacialis]|uniref:Uncharacterized protein n=1 Tax=Polarella glacialis TaxID=89957 RepID=A0A813JN89_POLGL|nr:unnamed protein product [Polarella glacialis]